MPTPCSEAKTKNAAGPPAARATEAAAPATKRSKAGRWRALALLLVHALIAVHIVHWAQNGTTMTPLEPSEAMEFGKKGLVNAGFVFFALAIGSTLLFGRWFCGWACHVVALQDACRWMLLKVGLRPRAVNLGILGVVPWLAFAYMFLAPVVDRLIAGLPVGVAEVELARSDFWGTFPPWPVALATFAVCGFAIVWLLGSKAFCTYGCPYGAIFGVVDQLSTLRIRVTDACEGCGHCTAVCSSNVRVHQEVRDWKMVVDAGCMKCLDCVSVCPKDALYVGFGAPALTAKRRAGENASPGAGIGRWILLACFLFAALAVFELSGSNAPFDLGVVAVLGAGSLAVAWFFRGKSERRSEYTLIEEALLAGLFLFAMLAFRGLHDWVPFLFALGLSAMLAYVALQALRLLYRANVGFPGGALRVSGRLTRNGVLVLAAFVPIAAAWWYGGSERLAGIAAASVARAGAQRMHRAQEPYNAGVAAYEAGRIDDAIAGFRAAVAIEPAFVEARENLAGALCAAGRFEDGIREYEAALRVRPDDPGTHVMIARASAELRDLPRARRHLERAVELAPALVEAHAMLSELCRATGDAPCADEHERRVRELSSTSR